MMEDKLMQRKINKHWKLVVILLLFLVGGIVFFQLVCLERPTSFSEDDVALEFVQRLEFENRFVISISYDGRYALTHEQGEREIFVYEWVDESFHFLKSIEGIPETWRLVDNGSIAWSHCGERFSLSQALAFNYMSNSDILICDIKTGTIQNLTGIAGKEDAPLVFRDGFYYDVLPRWSKDDKGIYFFRFGREDDETISRLCFVSLETGEVTNLLDFYDEESAYQIMPTIIRRNGTLFYTLLSPNVENGRAGIYKYVNGVEVLLFRREREEGKLVHLLDVSPDGDKIIYVCIYHTMNSQPEDSYHFFLASIESPKEAHELQPISSKGIIQGILFSPDGATLMQMERDMEGLKVYVYLMDVMAPAETQSLLYTGEYDPFFGWRYPLAGRLTNQLQPIWLSNGYIAINGEVPKLFRVVTR